MVTFHPVTLENNTSKEQFQNILCVLDKLRETSIIFTKANADTGGRIINKMMDQYVSRNPAKTIAVTSLGYLRYLSTMRFVDAVVGNSSSGIVEAPSFRIGTINIGDRQRGREKSESVIDCEPTKKSILEAFKILYSQNFQERLKNIKNPYGDGHSAGRVKKILKEYKFKNTLKKRFYDIEFKI